MTGQGPRNTLLLICSIAALAGCLAKEAPLGIADTSLTPQADAPQIDGHPQLVAVQSQRYDFRPLASDPNGDALTFSIQNKPAWATFDSATGRLTGTPDFAATGSSGNIVISVSDGKHTVALPAFDIAISRDGIGSVTLEWAPPQTNTDGSYISDLAGYVIYYGTDAGNYDKTIRIDNVGLTRYVVDNLVPATYFIVATAFNNSGVESGFSNEVARSVVIN